MNLLLSFVALTIAAGPAADSADTERDAIIVSTSWVHRMLSDPRLVLFHVGDRKEYDSLHLPGAQYLGTRELAIPHVEGALSLQIPEASYLDSVLEARGVTDSSVIVVYPGRDWISPVARVWLTLEQFGLGGRSHIMDGGMGAWIAEGKPVTAEVPSPARGSVALGARSDVVATRDWVRGHLNDPGVAILDARDPRYYTGRDTGVASRPGRIPGAANIPFSTLVDSSSRFLPVDSLRTLFAAAGMTAGKTAVSYCHIGQQASLVYVMARVLGYRARMYDGSMQEWTRDPDLPVTRDEPAQEKPPEP